MSVMIKSTIRSNPLGRWYIELQDSFDEDKKMVCLDINEYAQKIEMMGEEYGGDIDVAWESDENVTPLQINEVRAQIIEYEARQEAQKGTKTHRSDGTPNF